MGILVKSLSVTNKYRNKKCLQLSTWAPWAAYHPWSKLPGGPCLSLESGGDLKDIPNSRQLRMNAEHMSRKSKKKKEKLELASLWLAQPKKQTTSKFGSQ